MLIPQARLGSRENASWDWLEYSVCLMQLFAFLAVIFNLKFEETFEECVVNQLLQPMAIVIGSRLLK